MTTTDLSTGESSCGPTRHRDISTTEKALFEVIFGDQLDLHMRVRDVVVGLADIAPSGVTFDQEAERGPRLLREVIAALGCSAREISSDAQMRGALCDWAQVAAPRLLLVLTGHFDLAIGAILSLGNGSAYQQQCLAELDTGAALGVLMLTELGGTNGADQRTVAVWDRQSQGFTLGTPGPEAVKMMPNVADPAIPKTAVVTARLIVDGRDEGVLPFLLKLRTRRGLADGVHVARLPDKVSAPMDHGLIRFDDVWLPRDALLGGDFARIDVNGRVESGLPPRVRFHRAIGVLGDGRLDLANAAIASARASLSGLVNYACQRRPGDGTLLVDRDAVRRDLAAAVAAVYAMSALGRRLRDMRVSQSGTEPVLWSMLAKPLLTNTALEVLMMCRDRAAAQGALRINHLVDWIGNLAAMRTAEGENQIMQVVAGRRGAELPALRLPGQEVDMPWYMGMLVDRERVLAQGRAGHGVPARGRDARAIELATATGERLAVAALVTEAHSVTDPLARKLLESAAAAYALGRVHDRGTWYAANDQLDTPRAELITQELDRNLRVVAEHLSSLVAAFATPALPGPLFSGDYIDAWMEYAGWARASFPAGRNNL
ncbi:acyl-CoA dehydrogenase family protein [Nocardia sp. NPDC057668]|uniref:acyl-CoA dehydrogenase family protein n=1 Tax=Nocardia sp. NPDC057668 TaxID=3346202 RepID=UPI0036730FE6